MPEQPDAKGKDGLDELFHKSMAGDRDARQELITKWLPSILRVIRRKRTASTRSTYDSDDFTQLVRIKVDQIPFEDKHFASWDVFLSYVRRVAFNEVGQVERKVRRRPRQQPLPPDDQKLQDPGASPLVQQAAEDEWRRAVAALATPTQRNIARRMRQGVPMNEIAKALEVTDRTLRRVVADIEQFFGGGGRKNNAETSRHTRCNRLHDVTVLRMLDLRINKSPSTNRFVSLPRAGRCKLHSRA